MVRKEEIRLSTLCPEKGSDEKRTKGISRRQFMKTTGTASGAGILLGAGGISRLAKAGGFVDYLKYDGLGLADLVRRGGSSPRSCWKRPLAELRP
jgi:hypothetical protein